MVGVTSQDQNRRSQQGSRTSRGLSNKTGTGTGCRNKIQGPGKTHTKAESAGLGQSLKYTSISSFRMFGWLQG
ncbi:unnamed protein product [Staurois parvus]|uniref:Uncharacterized protein n=1 Tax=Staurois parvus TaxID=386267 RepID=A0ABN9FCX7_9NEOB|nr:unnamed protein product [Staurois parvus]